MKFFQHPLFGHSSWLFSLLVSLAQSQQMLAIIAGILGIIFTAVSTWVKIRQGIKTNLEIEKLKEKAVKQEETSEAEPL